jgi:membrane protein insertase Oxa1/YidC/SpoIIIJ
MGFTLPSAMGVYWFIGAIISLSQNLITQAVVKAKNKNKGVR